VNVKIIRVLGIRSKDPAVMATVDGLMVKWNSRRDWDCECLTEADEYECEHITAIRALLDDRVLTPQNMQVTR
jgi:hypothetical protein